MVKDDYVKVVNEKLKGNSRNIMLEQINNYYLAKNYNLLMNNYNVGDYVKLEKGTLLHGTYKNLEGLKEILKDGLISSWFIDGRLSKYPSSVGVWNLKKDYLLSEYINFYSGGTIRYRGLFKEGIETEQIKTGIIAYNEMNQINEIVKLTECHLWTLEQTKEARFMPSLVQDRVQIGIIFNGNNCYMKQLLQGDILNPDNISDKNVKGFVNPDYYEKFLKDRKNKDDFFTDRESAILFGIPSNFIEGILVGRKYESDTEMLEKIRTLISDCYICNLEGKVIIGNKK